MLRQKPKKLTVTATPEKTRPQKPFVQIEKKLTEEQLEAIAGGGPPVSDKNNHNETMVSAAELNI